jgi:hypothetical protein
MAYNFVRTSSQDITGALANIAPPLTLHVRFAHNLDASVNMALCSVSTVNGVLRHQVRVQSTTVFQASSNAGTGIASSSAGSIAANTWASGVGQFNTTTNRLAYLNAVAGTTSTAERIVTFNQLQIGADTSTTRNIPYNGDLADVAVWDVALTDAEIVSLAKGFKPYRIRPQSLRTYVPLIRNLQDVRGVVSLTANNGPTVADHPRVY